MVVLFTLTIAAFGLYAALNISVGAVPDITNNQVQVITTSGNLSTQEIEQYITTPVEMEMANLPGVKEIRSISKFGISLVTIVFDEKLGTYLPRQLIAEKIKTAASKIPEGFGEPEMGPITTGLGEIYQYTLQIKRGYEHLYTLTDLRTIQDWLIKCRLSGINGVVEINSWGGYLKQYEVAIDPNRLSKVGVTLQEVFSALEANNQITGGAYIEKNNQSFFIRADGQVKTQEEIAQIVVRNNQGQPILIRDIAKVRIGYANRYGAITANGTGETILGQVMMLKGADSKQVIAEVKNRINEIQKNLPEGIVIDPIVDRSELVAKTTFTVAENLILGALIVLFVVLAILGNWRSAAIITSIIPLSLLFTLSMMYILGIDANLMSLGALDFGIIIDGAVIIIEFIVLKVWMNKAELETSDEGKRGEIMDRISMEGSSKMMKSAIFGQIIILIVFIPILTLSGVEGKMFRPMAMTFCLAIIGAMIMGFTWLPVAASLFLKPYQITKRNPAHHIINFARKSYLPVIQWSFNHKRIVLGSSLVILIATMLLFSRMGGEFVPTLDEGDFVIQPVLKTGTSLSSTIELTTRMEKILMEQFPEVEKVVSRIGAAEVPTDPMSMEEIDMIIKLRPRSTWKTAKTKDELAEKFKEALSIIPGIEYEFTQPIEMRFNELITGVRSDIAIKIYGEDLEYVNQIAVGIKSLVEKIEGADEVILEKTVGLPQIKIEYNRSKIAYYGIDIKTINAIVSTAFAGQTTGVIFEGEKRFDLVVRFDERFRSNAENIHWLKIPLPSGGEIPLEEVASIKFTEGPAKISHDNTHRRVVVSVNVRNRDLQSVANDIRSAIEKNIALSPGTYIEYGGQFENLQNATNRLLIAVPVALLLIFIFLHFALESFKDAAMIYMAIPLSSIGGVLLLWLRGMPFSVSAGIGFIALFGIAVLNGIVLIEHLKELDPKNTGVLRNIIINGALDRLRPVMLTAGAAAMGFLPMAISSGAGAEVQRPLATVVIGGLISSTLLTMVILPLLYEILYNVVGIRLFPLRFIRAKHVTIILLISLPLLVPAQPKELTLDDAIQLAMENNKELKAFRLKEEEKHTLKSSAFDLDKTTFSYGYDQNNIAENNHPLKVLGVTQQFSFPTQYTSAKTFRKVEYELSKTETQLASEQIKKQVTLQYIEYQLLTEKLSIYRTIDSSYRSLLRILSLQQKSGSLSNIDFLNLSAQQKQAELLLAQTEKQRQISRLKLKILLGVDDDFELSQKVEIIPLANPEFQSPVYLSWLQLRDSLIALEVTMEKSKLTPDFTLNYFVGTNFFDDAKYYQGFEIGLSVPLYFRSQKAKIKAAKIGSDASKTFTNYEIDWLKSKYRELLIEHQVLKQKIEFYQNEGQELYEQLFNTAFASYRSGGMDYLHFHNTIETALKLKLDYLENIFQYTSVTLDLNFFTK